MTKQLEVKNIWNAPGYREISLTMIDPETMKEYRAHFPPGELQRLINACADAAKQIGYEGPIDWDRHPTTVYWPEVTPWKPAARQPRPGEQMIEATRRAFDNAR